MEYQKEFIRFSFKDKNINGQSPPYRLSYVPKSFEEKETVNAGAGFTTKYFNSNGMEIIFDQAPIAESGSISIDNENNFYQEITIEGYPAYLFEGKSKADRTIIIWQNSTYHFEIASRFNKSELLKMAESIAINK